MEWKPFPDPTRSVTESFADGQAYATPNLNFANHASYEPVVFFDGVLHTPLFTYVSLLGQVVIKLPTGVAMKNFLAGSISNSWFAGLNGVRSTEKIERSSRFGELLGRYPDFNPALEYGRNLVHYLLIHKLQYDRLDLNSFVGIPKARFVLIGTPRDPHPAIVQERINGPSLMSFIQRVLRSGGTFQPPCVKEVLGLANSTFVAHINWYPENFIWSEQERNLYYIESKPTTMIGRDVNDPSLRNIREDLDPNRWGWRI